MSALSFLSFWITNSVVFYLSFLLWPSAIVLGNNIRSPIIASMLSGFLLTIIIALVPFVLKLVDLKLKEEGKIIGVYYVFNVVGIWVIARLANFTGFGIVAFWVALILGAVISFFQWGVFKTTTTKGK